MLYKYMSLKEIVNLFLEMWFFQRQVNSSLALFFPLW